MARVLVAGILLVASGCTHVRYRADQAPDDYRGPLWRFKSPTADIRRASFSPDGRFILISSPYACRVLETNSGHVVSLFEHGGELRRPLDYLYGALILIPYSIGHLMIATVGESSRARPPAPRPRREPVPGERQIRLASWSDDSRHVLFFDRTLRLRTYEATSGRTTLPDRDVALNGHDRIMSFLGRPDLRWMWIGTESIANESVQLSRAGTWSRRWPPLSTVSHASAGQRVAVSGPDGSIHVLDSESGRDISTVQCEPGCHARISRDGTRLAVLRRAACPGGEGSCEKSIEIVDAATGDVLSHMVPVQHGIRGHLRDWASEHDLGLFHEFSATGQSHIVVADLATGVITATLAIGREQVCGLSSDGCHVVTVAGGIYVRVYKVAHRGADDVADSEQGSGDAS